MDDETFEERAAFIEFDAGLFRKEAKDVAAQQQGENKVVELRYLLKGKKDLSGWHTIIECRNITRGKKMTRRHSCTLEC